MTARMRTAPRRGLAALAVACAAAAAGCQTTGRHGKTEPPPSMIDCNQPRELQMVSQPMYIVEPPDELEISTRPAVPDVPQTVTVQGDGNIDLGYLGDVYVNGMTLLQVEQKVAQQLQPYAARKKLDGAIEVSARLVNGSQSKSYYVMGAVTTQGKFPVTGGETVLDAILTAGLRSNSQPEKAYLVRPHPAGGSDLILKIDWDALRDHGDTLTNYQIFPGDRIIVPGGRPPGLLSTLFGGG